MRRSTAPEYTVWNAMIQRCHNPNDKGFRYYGSRGITVCARWRKYENFLKDMGRRPSNSHSIERVKNGHGYSPSNVRWATRKEQMRNTRFNTIVRVGTAHRCVAAWSERSGISSATIIYRLQRGWSPKDAVTVRPKFGLKLYAKGKRRTAPILSPRACGS